MTTSPSTVIYGTGSSFPKTHYTTEEMIAAFHKGRAEVNDDQYDASFVDRLFPACQFDAHSVALTPFAHMERSEYLVHRRTTLVDLAAQAAENALALWGGERSEITHLYWGTMTGGMDSPTNDILLLKRLGLSLDVERVSIEGMGCLTGFRLLNLGRQAVQSNENARVLVISGDLRSALGNCLPGPGEMTRGDIVTVALFRDSASAAVLGSIQTQKPHEKVILELLAGKSRLIPNSDSLANYKERDDGSIRLFLDKMLPIAVGQAEPDFVSSLMRDAFGKGEEKPSISSFDIACHTGGPKVLTEVASAIGAKQDQLKSSWAVMKAHGNLSGASNLCVLDHLVRARLESGPSDTRKFVLGIAMGPGICLEGALMRWADVVAEESPRSILSMDSGTVRP